MYRRDGQPKSIPWWRCVTSKRLCIRQRCREGKAIVPDWKSEIRQRLAGLRLEPTREAEIVEELAQHLDDRYEELLISGKTADEAYRAVLAEFSDNDLLAQELQQVERPMMQEPVALRTGRR